MLETATKSFTISPTDLVYLWDECRVCFVSKYKDGLELPRSFSQHFTSADRAMRKALSETEIVDLGVGPRFKVLSQGEWVESREIAFPEYDISLKFRGQCDALVITEDEEFYIVDYKTTTQKDDALRKFRRQLSSYATAIELPARQNKWPTYVEGLALLIFDPSAFRFTKETKEGELFGTTRWLEFPRRNDLFDDFLRRVAEALSQDTPKPSVDCAVCRLRLR